MVLFGLISIGIAIQLYLYFKPTDHEKVDADKFKKEIDAYYASAKNDSIEEDDQSSYSGDRKYPSKNSYGKEIKSKEQMP